MKSKFLQTTISAPKLVKSVARQLKTNSNQANLEHEAWLLLQHLTQKNKTLLLMQQEIRLSPKKQKNLNSWIKQITIEHKPIQYIIGSVPFCNVQILVEPPILIPRPETEELTCWFIDKLKKIDCNKLKILDLCSGSGCIGIAIAKSFPNFEITCVDISPKAIDLIKKNIKHNKIKNVKIIQSDLYKNILTNKKYDLIISNPPYVTLKEWEDLEKNVKEWEDKAALIAKNNGLEIFSKIIKNAKNCLTKTKGITNRNLPKIVLEMGCKQANQIIKLLAESGFKQIKTFKDLAGKNRWTTASL